MGYVSVGKKTTVIKHSKIDPIDLPTLKMHAPMLFDSKPLPAQATIQKVEELPVYAPCNNSTRILYITIL